jgi:DNA modification methylase
MIAYQNPYLTVWQSDALEALRQMPDESVHLVVTSPPYDSLRTYGGHSWDFEGLARELYRVLVAGGVLCWNVNDATVDGSETLTSCKQKIFFREQVGFRIHDTMIWQKLNFANPETARYHQLFEYVFVLSKGKPRAFNPLKDKRNATAGRIGCLGINSYTKRDGAKSTRTKYVTQGFGMRGNVWTGPSRGQEEFCGKCPHPAMMPKWLARDLILSWSNAGDVVLDPMAGSGTTLLEAIQNGRRAIGIEAEESYIPLILQYTDRTIGLPLTA